MIFFSPLMYVGFYALIGSAYSLLYGAALRCRGEGGEIAVPASSRGRKRNGSSFAVRPATLLWGAFPIAMLTKILVKVIGR